jgi:hypothetical protein
MSKRYIIRHIPTDKVYVEDEGGNWLVERDEAFISYGRKEGAEDIFEYIKDMADDNDGILFTEMGDFPIEEFEVSEL